MPAGRPTLYKPEYCEMLIKHMAEGLSFDTFGVDIDVCDDTLYEWVKKFPEFADAKKKGQKASLLFWTKLGRAGAAGKIKGFNAACWIFTMKCRFRWDDMSEIKLSKESSKLIIDMSGIRKNEGADK